MGRRITAGAALLFASRLAVRFVGLFSTMVLARVLLPEDFGLVALALSYLAIIEGLTAVNLNSALIKIQDNSPELYNSAWTLGFIRSCFIFLIILVSASFLPGLMKEPRLENVIYILALQPLLQGLYNPRFIEFEKNLNYRPIFWTAVCSKIIAAALTVAIAIIYQSYWALIAGSMASSFIHLIMTYALAPHIPRWSLARWREIFGFTAWLSGVSILSALNLRADSFIVGGFLDTKHVGYYRIGEDLATLPTGELIAPLTQSLFPAFSAMAHEPEKLRVNVLEASSIIGSIGLPLAFGFAFLAEDTVRLLVGEKWLFVVPMIQILTPILGLQTLVAVTNSVCMATGRTRLLFNSEIIFSCVRLSAIIAGVIFWGFAGIIGGRVISGLTHILISSWRLQQAIHTPYFSPIIYAWRSIASAVAMVGVLWGFQHNDFFKIADLALWARLASSLMLGTIAYISVHAVLWKLSGSPAGPETRMLHMARSIKRNPTNPTEL